MPFSNNKCICSIMVNANKLKLCVPKVYSFDFDIHNSNNILCVGILDDIST